MPHITRGRKTPKSRSKKPTKSQYFNKGNKLTEENRKYCRCVLHVAAQQPAQCLEKRSWGSTVNGKKCYNPYAVCTSATHRKGKMLCFKDTHLSAIPGKELSALAHLKRLTPSRLKLKQLLERKRK
jgi:hypothetical protein